MKWIRCMKTSEGSSNTYGNQIKKIMKKYMVILPLSAMTLFVALPAQATAQIAVLESDQGGRKEGHQSG